MACGIVVPGPRIAPGAPAMKALRPNHWAAREFPRKPFLKSVYHCFQTLGNFKRTAKP